MTLNSHLLPLITLNFLHSIQNSRCLWTKLILLQRWSQRCSESQNSWKWRFLSSSKWLTRVNSTVELGWLGRTWGSKGYSSGNRCPQTARTIVSRSGNSVSLNELSKSVLRSGNLLSLNKLSKSVLRSGNLLSLNKFSKSVLWSGNLVSLYKLSKSVLRSGNLVSLYKLSKSL